MSWLSGSCLPPAITLPRWSTFMSRTPGCLRHRCATAAAYSNRTMSLNDGNPAFRGILLFEFFKRMESRDGKVGILLLDFHFSSRSSPGLWECGNRVRCDFQGLWETRETCLWLSSFPIARHFHRPLRRCLYAVCLRPKVANSFCFSFCIRLALDVSLSFPALWFITSTVISGFIYRARSGSCRRISHGVAYQR